MNAARKASPARKAIINATVDADVRAWIESESKRRRLTVATLVNSLLAERMLSDLAHESIVQVHTGNGHQMVGRRDAKNARGQSKADVEWKPGLSKSNDIDPDE